MSWQDNITKPYSITTGDGIDYHPLWNPQRSVVLNQEFNIARFEFKGIKGSLVDRGEVKGNVYDIEVCFVGADHLEQAKDFRESAKDKRLWVINHPYYGRIVCHPASLRYNNEDGNVTRITGQILETIKGDNIFPDTSPREKIAIDKLDADNALFGSYIAEVPSPQVLDIQALDANLGTINTSALRLVKLQEDYNAFKNAVNTAGSYINQANSYIYIATNYAANAIGAIQYVISAPAFFIDSEVSRVQMLYDALQGFYNGLSNISISSIVPRTIKHLYENNGGTCISSMCLASVTNNTSAFDTRDGVVQVITQILNGYNGYLNNLDALQTANNGHLDSYSPDVDSINLIASLVNYTVSALLTIAANAKQLVTYTLAEDDNVTTLAYKLYGSGSDANIDKLITDNNLNYRDLLLLKKGRQITYYS
jgi:hypothetical protein